MVGLLGAAEIRQLAQQLDLNPSKKLGQNFVTDANTIRRITSIAQITADDIVLEVGPGLGSLSFGILDTGAELIAVELDARLAELLPETAKGKAVAPGKLTVIQADALRIMELPKPPNKLVANLPYNVSVPVLLHLLKQFPSIEQALVMVQAEVGHRLAAKPGSKTYGGPSIKAAWWGDWKVATNVSRQVFWPVPNVDSVLVSFQKQPRPEQNSHIDREHLFALIDASFEQRRKTLRQSLATVYGSTTAAGEALAAAGIDSGLRGEALELPDFIKLAAIKNSGV